MRQYLPNVLIFVVLAGGLAAGWWYVDKTYFPKPEPKTPEPPPPAREGLYALAGTAVGHNLTEPAHRWPQRTWPEPKPEAKPKEPPKAEPPKPAAPAQPAEFIPLGDESFYKQVMLTDRGGAIQSVTLRAFDEANRLGLEVKGPDGKPQRLHVIPGVVEKRDEVSLTDLHNNPALGVVPDLPAGKGPVKLPPHYDLAEPSYQLLHYPTAGDPLRRPKNPQEPKEFDEFPSRELADRTWTVVERQHPKDGGPHRVVFETTLAAPYFLKLRKTYTLAPKDYHVGFRLDVEALPGRVKEQGKFKYQIVGGRHLPIEGEWYAPTYRNVLVGWRTRRGGAKRTIQDAKSIQDKHGGDVVDKNEIEDGVFTYAATADPYFASALAVDDTAPPGPNPWEYVRPTREAESADWTPERRARDEDGFKKLKAQEDLHPFLLDVTFRAVSKPVDPAAGEAVSHHYLIYDGPIKVRLLGQLRDKDGNREVPDDLLYRYLDNLTLRTMTDYHSPTFFGRVANAIWWSDLVITFTNLMHEGLGALHHHLGLPWWLSIILLTVCVRLILMVPSRKQQAAMMRMQEKMARMKPEMDKLQEKYKHEPQLLQQEKARLMFKHGVNPLSTMGGCLMLFAQMPVFMGLYFCLQESVFFRLQTFLWVPNLSAPDMLVWWTESIPFVSDPSNLGGTTYLGPFLNILPLIAVALIFVQQKISTPPPTDEQQEMQQRMMKIMIVFMAVFFYKVPAGLCLYFICSTSWALMERKLIPKPKVKDVTPPADGPDRDGGGVRPTGPTKPSEPENGTQAGGFLGRLKAKLDEMQRQADEQSSRQIRNEPPKPGGPGGGGGRDRKKKRKK